MKKYLCAAFAAILILAGCSASSTMSPVQPVMAASSGSSCLMLQSRSTGSIRATEGSFNVRNSSKQLAKYTPNWQSIGGGKKKAVFCVNRSKLSGVNVITFTGEDGHYTLRGSETRFFRTKAPGPNGPFGRDDIAKMWAGG